MTPRQTPPCEGGIAHALRSRPWGFWAAACAACALAFSVLAEASSGNPAFPFGELLFWATLLLAVCVLGRPPAARRAMGPAALAGSALYALAGGALLFGLIACAGVAMTLPMLVGIPGAASRDAIMAAGLVFQFAFLSVAAAILFGALRVSGCRVRVLQVSGIARLGGCVFSSSLLYMLIAGIAPSDGGVSRSVFLAIGSTIAMTPFFLSCVLAVRHGWISLIGGPSASRCRPPARCVALAALAAFAALAAALVVSAVEIPFGAGVLSIFAYVGQGIQLGEYRSESAAAADMLSAFSEHAPALGVEAAAAALVAALSLALAVSALPAGSRAGALRRMPRALLAAAACVVFYEGAGLALYRASFLFGDEEGFLSALAVFRAAALPLALASAALLAARAASGARDPAPAEGVEGAVGDARE